MSGNEKPRSAKDVIADARRLLQQSVDDGTWARGTEAEALRDRLNQEEQLRRGAR